MAENYDLQELKKFSSLSSQWWDTEGPMKSLHQINPLRLSYIKEKTELAGKAILDIGCGGGILAESLAQASGEVTAIDLNQSLIHIAKLHQKQAGLSVDYLCQSAEALATERPASYDIITCMEMLEHIPDPAAMISACAALAKPGARLFFSTINRGLKAYLYAILGAEYILKILPPHTHDYAKFIKPSELANWARNAKLTPLETRGIIYNPFTKQFKLASDITVNYIFYLEKP